MLLNSLTSEIPAESFDRDVRPPSQAGGRWRDQQPRSRDARLDHLVNESPGLHNENAGEITIPMVQISPADAVTRRTVICRGITAEIFQATRHDRIEYRFCAPVHMLVVYEQGVRDGGDTFVQGVGRSALRDLRRKLTFVPAGHAYRECQELRALSRVTYFYFDPVKVTIQAKAGAPPPAPRLYFENAALWDTALKLISSIESASADNQLYLEALGVVLAHELGRLDSAKPAVQAPVRGGLAAWQKRVVATYIEEHLS